MGLCVNHTIGSLHVTTDPAWYVLMLDMGKAMFVSRALLREHLHKTQNIFVSPQDKVYL